jgi:hypothetical protein
MLKPPSTGITVLEMNFGASLARKKATLNNSSGFQNLLNGVCLIINLALEVRYPFLLIKIFLF